MTQSRKGRSRSGGMRDRILAMPIVDTHSHMTDASFDRYLAGEVGPFAAAAADGESIWELTRKPGFPDNVRPLMKRLYRDTGNLAYKRAVTRGCRELYGFKGEWIDWDDRRLFERAAEARAGGIAALYLDVMARANIQHVLRLCSPWDDTIRLPASRQGFLMYVDGLVAARREMPRQAARGRARTAATLDEHLRAVGSHLSAAKSAGAVGLKVGLATRRSLRFEAVSMARARRLFGVRRELTPGQQTEWEDFMMHRVAAEAGRQGLPLVFHTGFLWGQHADIARTRPGLLHNLFDAFPATRFAILHAVPYEGEAAYLCSMFANVSLDFTWTAMLSPTRFRTTFNEWIESVPESKFMWGSDSSSPEAHLGVTLETRELIADILCQRVRRGRMSEASAFEFAQNALRDNARRFYGIP